MRSFAAVSGNRVVIIVGGVGFFEPAELATSSFRVPNPSLITKRFNPVDENNCGYALIDA